VIASSAAGASSRILRRRIRKAASPIVAQYNSPRGERAPVARSSQLIICRTHGRVRSAQSAPPPWPDARVGSSAVHRHRRGRRGVCSGRRACRSLWHDKPTKLREVARRQNSGADRADRLAAESRGRRGAGADLSAWAVADLVLIVAEERIARCAPGKIPRSGDAVIGIKHSTRRSLRRQSVVRAF